MFYENNNSKKEEHIKNDDGSYIHFHDLWIYYLLSSATIGLFRHDRKKKEEGER